MTVEVTAAAPTVAAEMSQVSSYAKVNENVEVRKQVDAVAKPIEQSYQSLDPANCAIATLSVWSSPSTDASSGPTSSPALTCSRNTGRSWSAPTLLKRSSPARSRWKSRPTTGTRLPRRHGRPQRNDRKRARHLPPHRNHRRRIQSLLADVLASRRRASTSTSPKWQSE